MENITTVVDEYKRSRGLLPIRLCVMGPPAAGKSLIASQLCQHYKLHHLKIADVIQQAIEKLVSSWFSRTYMTGGFMILYVDY